MRFPVIATLLVVLLSACAQPASQGQQSSASPSASPVLTAAPSPTPPAAQGAGAPSAVPSSSTGPLPAATPPPATVAPGATLSPGAAAAPQSQAENAPNAPPKILDLHLDKTVVQSGEVVSGTVRTSLNTASVEARIGGYGMSVPKVGAGQFALRYTVPNLPFFLKRTYDMVVIARNTAGVKTQRVVPITIR